MAPQSGSPYDGRHIFADFTGFGVEAGVGFTFNMGELRAPGVTRAWSTDSGVGHRCIFLQCLYLQFTLRHFPYSGLSRQ
jgi:hypothetical protein